MARIIPLTLVRNDEVSEFAPSIEELRAEVDEAFAAAVSSVEEGAKTTDVRFRDAEDSVRELVCRVGRALLMLFLALSEDRLLKSAAKDKSRFEWLGRTYRKAPATGRNLSTLFGVIRYHRLYMREVAKKNRRGFHPLDLSLGLGSDRFSWNVLSAAVRLATKLSFAEARTTMMSFVPHTPSTEVMEKAVLGFGRHTEAWLDKAPLPQKDGEVLIIQVDSKGAPTATEEELRRRRGKRRKRFRGKSKRHRGRDARGRYAKKPRRKKGDKSKNAKMATMVVMYTLRRVGRRLEGPVNRWVYASFAPKKHAFEVARRMADKRGFTAESGKLVQVVTDGDTDLDRLVRDFFRAAEHTIDYYHVCEYLWAAGGCLYAEGSDELKVWVERQKERLFDDEADKVVAEMCKRLNAIPKRGPGNKGRRERLSVSIRYISKRLANIRYGALRRRDLELGTGAVEGAIKHVIGRRCDHGGMRWIKERAEAVLQLRCIEVNGQWDLFERFAHDRSHLRGLLDRAPPRLQSGQPQELPLAA